MNFEKCAIMLGFCKSGHIQHLSNNLLALPAIILVKVDAIHSRDNFVLTNFLNLFQGLGTMPCEYGI